MSFAEAQTLAGGSLDQYLDEINSYPLIDREQEARLAQRIQEGDHDALNELVQANVRFVVYVAKKYQNRGVPLADLISEGNLGLIRAARRFDETRGVKFISYAVWWIRQAILSCLAEQGQIVRMPQNRASIVRQIKRHRSDLVQELGREPTLQELGDGLDLSKKEVREGLRLSRSDRSLDAPLTPGEDNRLLNYLPDGSTPGTEEAAHEDALRERIREMLATLDAREAKILRLYYGLDGQERLTLREIGERVGVTRERVRQIKEKALERLRHPSRVRFLQTFR